jgi:hypothetical protein
MSDAVKIQQVLLISDETLSEELGPALWAALIEIERFYNLDRRRGVFDRWYLSPHVPSLGIVRSAVRSVSGIFKKTPPDAFSSLKGAPFEPGVMTAPAAAGRYAQTHDQEKIGEAVRGMLKLRPEDGRLLVVTDLEITPPTNWRYIIWDKIEAGAAVSLAPLDPNYWGDPSAHRAETIKHRTRTAGLCVTGEWLGLHRCDNPFCFLYKGVDSTSALDFMTGLGNEHEIDKLGGHGFEQPIAAPAAIQDIVAAPQARGWS